MGLRVFRKFNLGGMTWKSGHMYIFNYARFKHDSRPLILLLYKIRGRHPRSKNEWNLIQGLNLNYVSRSVRRQFVVDWKKYLIKNNGNVSFTWNHIKKKYPGVVASGCIRRYLVKPMGLITNVRYIPIEDMEIETADSWMKDYSKKLRYIFNGKINSIPNVTNMVSRILNFMYGGKG